MRSMGMTIPTIIPMVTITITIARAAATIRPRT
jgi:hypothetical protein